MRDTDSLPVSSRKDTTHSTASRLYLAGIMMAVAGLLITAPSAAQSTQPADMPAAAEAPAAPAAEAPPAPVEPAAQVEPEPVPPPPPAAVQPPAPAPAGLAPLSTAAAGPVGIQPRLVLQVGTSRVVEVQQPLVRASIGAPDTAEVNVLSPMQVLVTGRTIGTTQLLLQDKNNRQQVYDIMVEPDLAQLRAAIAEAAPGSQVDVRVVRDSVVLAGKVADVDTADRVVQLAKIVSPNVQNQLTIAGEQQVLLRCTVAEVNKRSLRQLGINGWLGGENFRDAFAVSQIDGINPVNIGAAGGQDIRQNVSFLTDRNGLNMANVPTLSLGFPRVQMQLFIKAMRENDLLRVLAEPNLVALNGQTASFVAGGEFPVPIPQGVSGAVTIEFKEFGIRLNFIPTVLGRQMIRLRVQPEVSELDFTAAVQFSGFLVPGLSKRRAETTVELASGTTIALAGLLSDQVRASSKKTPALGDVPVLGALFSSVDYQRNTTELVILITPELVTSMHPDQVPPVPGQFSTEPNDFELFGLQMVEGKPVVDESCPTDALRSGTPPQYRKFSCAPEQMTVHGPWGPADANEAPVKQ
jgi:pilus assembly protein CpaC